MGIGYLLQVVHYPSVHFRDYPSRRIDYPSPWVAGLGHKMVKVCIVCSRNLDPAIGKHAVVDRHLVVVSARVRAVWGQVMAGVGKELEVAH